MIQDLGMLANPVRKLIVVVARDVGEGRVPLRVVRTFDLTCERFGFGDLHRDSPQSHLREGCARSSPLDRA